MRIVLTTDGDEYGGAEKSLVNLVNASDQNIEFVLIGRDCVSMQELCKRLPDLPSTLIPGRPKSLATVLKLRKAYKYSNPQIVQVTLCNPGAARDAQVAAVSLGIPTIAVEQLFQPTPKIVGRWLKTFVSKFLVDHVSVGGSSARLTESYFHLPEKSVRVIYNGVPNVSRKPIDLGQMPVVGCVARLEEQKSLDILISAIEKIPTVKLVIVGAGSKLYKLQELADALGIDKRVVFAGWQDDPVSYIAAFDVFVLPSKAEAFPLSIVESMLARTPIVATNVGSVSEAVIHEETGLLVEAGCLEGLVKSIEIMLQDKKLAEKCTKNAFDLATKKYTDSAMADGYKNMWSSPRGRTVFQSSVTKRS